MRAAFDLSEGRPLHERYIYPPLLAAACELLVPLGRGKCARACGSGDVLAASAFAGLLSLTLVRHGFDPRASACLVLAFMAINVPVLRTLVYGQVNLHVANLILLALLAYPRFPVGSALALALAVHLKSSPVVLVLPGPAGGEPPLAGGLRRLDGRGRGRDLRRPRSPALPGLPPQRPRRLRVDGPVLPRELDRLVPPEHGRGAGWTVRRRGPAPREARGQGVGPGHGARGRGSRDPAGCLRVRPGSRARRPQRLARPGRAHGAGVAPGLGAPPRLRRAAVSRDHAPAAGARRVGGLQRRLPPRLPHADVRLLSLVVRTAGGPPGAAGPASTPDLRPRPGRRRLPPRAGAAGDSSRPDAVQLGGSRAS